METEALMATVISDRTYTPEDLLQMPDGDRYELVNGQLIEGNMSGLATATAASVIRHLGNYVVENQLGIVFASEAQYRCFPDEPRKVRKPDASFVQTSRYSSDLMHGLIRIPPDLAVEVVSDNDTYYEVEDKISDYLAAGVRLIWVFNPPTRNVRVLRPNAPARQFAATETISGEDVLPGFSMPVAAFFEMPPTAAP
jgi:Uma2 family endonuclease